MTGLPAARESSPGGSGNRFLAAATLIVVVASLGQALYAAWDEDWTYDEEVHLLWTRRLLETGETERESHPRFNSRTPIVLPNVLALKTARALGVVEPERLRFAARLPTVILLGLTFAVVFAAMRAFVTPAAAAFIATTIVALDPNLIAHGSLVTVDLAYTLAVWSALAAGLAFCARPGVPAGLALGAAVGLAFAAKFTAVVLALGLLPIAVWIFRSRPAAGVRRVLVALTVAAVAAWVTLSGMYLFLDLGAPIGTLGFKSGLLRPLAEALPGLRLPLPAAFATGLDASIATERQDWNAYLLGRMHPKGVWYYFVVVWALKTPITVILALITGMAYLLVHRRLRSERALLLFGFNLLLNLAYFSLVFKTQVGYRYVLMCVPLAAALAAAGLATLASPSRVLPIAVSVWIAAATLEVLPYLGNPIAFTNAAVWPKREAFRLLADSNLDWGQNRGKVEAWQASGRLPQGVVDPVHILPGTNVLSVNALAGIRDFERHRWLRENGSPLGHAGHTYLWFDVSEAMFERFMVESRLWQPSDDAATVCSGPGDFAPMRPGQHHDFTVTGADPDQLWVACVRSTKWTSLGLRVFKAGLIVGRYRPGEPCVGERVGEGGLVWFRLGPGLHALCADEIPNRRAFLPYYMKARWIIRGRRAEMRVRRGRVQDFGTPNLHALASGAGRP